MVCLSGCGRALINKVNEQIYERSSTNWLFYIRDHLVINLLSVCAILGEFKSNREHCHRGCYMSNKI